MTDLLDEVLEESRQLGFLGPGPIGPQRIRAAAFAEAVAEPPARALDLGAGGGLPGLVLASMSWPSTRWTFLDARARRTAFLENAAERLGMGDRVQVVTQRAEVTGRDPAHRGAYDLVVARSFGRPSATAECAAPLMVAGGLLVVSEPPEPDESRWPAAGLARFGFGPARALVVGDDPAAHLVAVRLEHPVSDVYPRRDGVPAQKPLF